MADPTTTLTPEELLYYKQRQDAVSRQYGQGNAQLQYQRGVNDQNYGYGLGDLQKRFKSVYQALPGQFQRRGVATSGIAQAGYNQYGTEYADALGRFNQQNQQQLDAYGLQQTQLDQSHAAAVGDLYDQETARKSAAADTYRNAKGLGS